MIEIRADDVTPTPWRNGGGQTRELLAWPAGPDWTIRVSVADIERDGPFSAFPGVERWFAILEGRGVLLGLTEGTRRVVVGDPPVRFNGAPPPTCALIEGPVRDFNLMVRGGTGVMRAIHSEATRDERVRCPGLFTVRAGVWSCGTGFRREVPANTLLFDLPDAPGRFVSSDTGPLGWWFGAVPTPNSSR